MAFNKQNTVEHFIIQQLTGGNLDAVYDNVVKEDASIRHGKMEICASRFFDNVPKSVSEK